MFRLILERRHDMKWSKEFLKALLIRAIRTGAQTALSLITVGVTIFDIDWISVLGVTAVAMIASALTSIVTDLPEVGFDGTVDSAMLDPEGTVYKTGDIVRLKVTDGEEA